MALTLKSERQIQSGILATIIAQLGLNDVNPASVTDILTQSVAQQDFALYYQIAQTARLVNLDALTGDDLDNKAFEYGLTRIKAQKTQGPINILRPDGFVKVSTNFYAGSPSPVSGDSQIDVNDASNSLIDTSGTLVLGRGTNNEEEVTYSVAPTSMGTFWRYALVSPLTKDHTVEETVILKQGTDEPILTGTAIIVPATGVSAEIQFTVDTDTVLLAGEAELDDIEVTAVDDGTDSNIPIGAISGETAFSTPPFPGARAENVVKFTTGKDLESDDDLRDRIKNYIQGVTKAVKQAILNAIVGLVDPVTAKRVVSASVVLPVDVAGDVKVYIDSGDGFEPSFSSIGFETVLSSSTGGEERLQVDNIPISKAQVESLSEEFYDMSSGSLTLLYQVGTIQESVTFNPGDFRSPDIATAEEITAVINDRSTLIEARTSQIGKFVLITAKKDVNESIQVLGGSANAILNFPTDLKYTLNLYIDDVKKSKDGETATLDSGNEAPYNLLAVGSYPHTIVIIVDGKSANPQTATMQTSDVSDTAAVTTQEICNVINRDIAGLTATSIDANTKVRLESLTKLSGKSKLHVTGGSMNDSTNGLNFSTSESVGVDGDYSFNRELGIIQLATPLVANENVTLGSQFTRAKLRTANHELYSPTNTQTLIISVDGGSNQTITFDGTFSGGKTAEDSASFINARLLGASAIVRKIGGQNYLEINTDTYDSTGSLVIRSSSTGNLTFGFPTDQTVTSNAPNKAFVKSGASSPFNFAQSDSLVVVLDNDIVNKTYAIVLNFNGSVTTAVSTTVFQASALSPIFQNQDEIKDFYVGFTSGANTVSGTVTDVADQGSGIARYTFSPTPGTFGMIAIGDLVRFTGLDDSENNVSGVITAVGGSYVEITNAHVIPATLQTGTGMMSERRRVTAYNELTGQITVGSAFSHSASISDAFIVIPSTVSNLVEYLNNVKITSFSLSGNAEGANNNTKLQLSSKSEGSDGYVQVTGGAANDKLQFSTVQIRGLQAYNYWTGLLALVHKTIYGDDTDLETFPGVGAAGITFRVLAPTVRAFQIQLDVTLSEGVTISALENDIKSAVTGYVNTLGVGDDVIIERIRAAVIAIPGIIDVVINDPTENIPIADNEKAFVADPDVLIG